MQKYLFSKRLDVNKLNIINDVELFLSKARQKECSIIEQGKKRSIELATKMRNDLKSEFDSKCKEFYDSAEARVDTLLTNLTESINDVLVNVMQKIGINNYDSSNIINLINHELRQYLVPENVTIRCHVDDEILLSEALVDVVDQREILILVDDSIGANKCVLETEISRVEIDIKSAVNELNSILQVS